MNSIPRPLVSVVTPVHNGEPYLEDCIKSVLAQTYQNWEYILVNNCSTDRTLEIVSAWVRRDSRIRVHSNRTLVKMGPNHDIALSLISRAARTARSCTPTTFCFRTAWSAW